ncbi:MAG: hypothetical protein E7062_05625 [Spirochaetaceae bacterium]|nr:hypothetical protein [Spirochaetaceae bacterium]
MSIFFKYARIFTVVVLVQIVFQKWFAVYCLYQTPEEFIPGLMTTFALAFVLWIGCLIVAKKILNPFQNLLNRIQQGEEVAEEEKSVAFTSFSKIIVATIVVASLGFFIGQLAIIILETVKGRREFDLLRSTLQLLQSCLVGGLGALQIIFAFDESLIPFRKMLKLKTFSLKKRELSISSKLRLVTTFSILYTAINMFLVGYGILYNPIENQETVLNTFFIRSSVVFFISITNSFLITYYILYRLKRRIFDTSVIVNELAENGDIKNRIAVQKFDDFGILTSNINKFMDTINNIIDSFNKETILITESSNALNSTIVGAKDSLEQVSSAFQNIEIVNNNQNILIDKVEKEIEKLVIGAQQVDQHVQDQSTAIQQTSAAIAQMVANIASCADMAKKADALSNEFTETSELGQTSIANAVTSINEIQESSLEVQDIVKAIQKIASQTNLLSMNAAIEAAHAGQYGQGFAVVADEVRSLAASSAKSAKEIQLHIKDMVTKIDGGVTAIKDAGEAFAKIGEKVEQNKNLVQTISAAMEEQRLGAEETLHATSTIVNSVNAIRDLSSEQTSYTETVKKAVQDVVTGSGKVSETIKENHTNRLRLQDSIKQVEESIELNSQSVKNVQKNLNKFNN